MFRSVCFLRSSPKSSPAGMGWISCAGLGGRAPACASRFIRFGRVHPGMSLAVCTLWAGALRHEHRGLYVQAARSYMSIAVCTFRRVRSGYGHCVLYISDSFIQGMFRPVHFRFFHSGVSILGFCQTGIKNQGLESMGPDFGEMLPFVFGENPEILPHSCRGRISVAPARQLLEAGTARDQFIEVTL